MKKALVIGATGLAGSALIQLLLKDDRFEKVAAFVRRTTKITHPKFKEHLVSFDAVKDWKQAYK